MTSFIVDLVAVFVAVVIGIVLWFWAGLEIFGALIGFSIFAAYVYAIDAVRETAERRRVKAEREATFLKRWNKVCKQMITPSYKAAVARIAARERGELIDDPDNDSVDREYVMEQNTAIKIVFAFCPSAGLEPDVEEAKTV
jgi:hypothetical protein